MDRYQKLLCEKAKKKRDLLGKAFLPRRPLLLIDFSETENTEEFYDLLQGLDTLGITTFVITENSSFIDNSKHQHLYPLLPDKKSHASLAADLVVIFDDNLADVWKQGTVPIAPAEAEHTLDYNPLQEKGNGFYFKNPTKWEIFASIVRAVETYQFPYDWENLVREVLRSSQKDTP